MSGLDVDMPYYEVFWNYESDDGNVSHIAEHGLTPDDVNCVLMDSEEIERSRSTGRPGRIRLHARWSIHLRRLWVDR